MWRRRCSFWWRKRCGSGAASSPTCRSIPCRPTGLDSLHVSTRGHSARARLHSVHHLLLCRSTPCRRLALLAMPSSRHAVVSLALGYTARSMPCRRIALLVAQTPCHRLALLVVIRAVTEYSLLGCRLNTVSSLHLSTEYCLGLTPFDSARAD